MSTASKTHARAVLDRVRTAVDVAGLPMHLVDELPTPLLVCDLVMLAVALGCSAADFLAG